MNKMLKLILSVSLLFGIFMATPGISPTRAASVQSKPVATVAGTVTFADKYAVEGTLIKEIALPAKVPVILSNSKTQAMNVKWNTAAYNRDAIGTYTCKGILEMPAGVSNPKNITASINIKVVHPVNDPGTDTHMRISAGTPIDELDSLAAWISQADTVISLDSANKVSGTASLNISALTGRASESGYEIRKAYKKPLNLSNMNNMQFNFYVPDTSLIDHVAVIFNSNPGRLDSDCYTYWIGPWRLIKGWNRINLLKSEFTVEKTPSWNKISCVRIMLFPKKGCRTSINVDRISYNVSGRPEVLFTFDDGWYDLVDGNIQGNAFSCLSSKGFKATVWAIMSSSAGYQENRRVTDGDNNPAYLNETDLEKLYASGWDIGNHTVSHPDNINKLSEEQIKGEYLKCQDWLFSNSWTRGANFVCYPSGSYNERITEIMEDIGVKAARTTVYGLQPIPADNIFKLKCIYVDDLRDSKGNPELDDAGRHIKDIGKVKKEIDKAVQTGSTVIFMFHKIEDTKDPLALSTVDFKQIVDYVYSYAKQQKLKVSTMSEWYSDYTGDKLPN